MDFIFKGLHFVAALISLYSLIIFVRVMLTWVPSLAYSKFARLLSEMCDPYLQWFRRFNVRIKNLDFSPVLAIAVLMITSSVLSAFAATKSFSLRIVFAIVINIVWSIVNSFLFFLIILVGIRIVVLLFNKDSGVRFWNAFDQVVSPIVYKIAGFFFPKKYIHYWKVLLAVLILLLIVKFVAGYLINLLLAGLLKSKVMVVP